MEKCRVTSNCLHRDSLALNFKIGLITVAEWDSVGRVVTQARGRAFLTLGRAFQTLGGAFDFLLRLQKFSRVFGKLAQMIESLAKHLKGSAVCFETSTRPSVLLKRVYKNLVCKMHRLSIGVLCG